MPLSQAERSAIARLAANRRWALVRDRSAATAAARANSPVSLDYWVKKLDPEGQLTPDEVLPMATNAQKAHYEQLAMSGRRARAAKNS